MIKSLKKFHARSTEKEFIDDPHCSAVELIQNLKEFQKLNFWLNSQKILINSLKLLYKKHSNYFRNNLIKIADLGCGAGDLLVTMQKFLDRHNLMHNLYGLDFNPTVIHYAMQQHNSTKICYKTIDFLSDHDSHNLGYDIVCLNNICHHLSNKELIVLLKKLMRQTQLAIIINDLHRHFIAYYAIKVICSCFNLSHFAKHDGPLSVLRAFRKSEVAQLMLDIAAPRFSIKWCWPFRWQVIIWTQGEIR